MVRTFFPDVFESSNAALIAVRPGGSVERINIQLRTATGSKIEGRIVSQLPAPTNIPPIAAEYIQQQSNRSLLTIVPHNRNEFYDPRFGSTPAVSMEAPNNGVFQFGNVPPGVYDLFAPLPDPTGYGPDAPPGKAARPAAIGRATVEVRGGDVTGVTILVRRGTDVRGKIAIDGNPPAAAVRVSLRSADSSMGLAIFDQVSRFEPIIGPDGSFLIPAVPEGTYRLAVAISENAPSAYVADIRQGGTSVYDSGILVNPAMTGPIEVIINTNSGTVRGTVARTGQQPLTQSTMVALIPPEERRQNLALYRTTLTNAVGEFEMTGVPPGPYKLFAWESIPAGAHQNAAFVKTFEDKGAAILVPPGGSISSAVTLIP